MSIRIVQLGSPRHPDEGLRIGTVRRPPRGVPKSDFAAEDWYDVWFPNLAPSAELIKQGNAVQTDKQWQSFSRAFTAEMSAPSAKHDIALLAAMSRRHNFSVGCYCERVDRCHRSILRRLLADAGAEITRESRSTIDGQPLGRSKISGSGSKAVRVGGPRAAPPDRCPIGG